MSARTMHEKPEQVGGHWFIKLASGRMLGYWDAVSMIKAADSSFATAVSRAVKLAVKWGEDEAEMHDYYLERVEWLLDEMETYLGSARKHIATLRGDQSVRERIALLRNVSGREPAEAEAFLRKADMLEQELAS